jgi:N-acetylglucosamine-6-phosphate deacetylase
MTQALLWLCPDQIFDGQDLRVGMALGISDGMVHDIRLLKDVSSQAKRITFSGVVTPGYLDLQVNGGGDVLINNDPTPNAMITVAKALRGFGTVGIMPTVITDSPDILAKAVDAAIAAKSENGILGLHIEGPHISLTRRGTHAAQFVRPLDAATINYVERLRHSGIAVIITLAPEAVQPGQVRSLVNMGAIVSIGHSDAATEQVKPLLDEGAKCFTHLFNAMSPMLNRAEGVTGAAINSTAYCGFICDGHHVSDNMLGLAIRARPIMDRMFLVSDCMSTVGGTNQFMLYGQKIRLMDGRLVNAEGSLAGAHITMAQSVARLISVLGIAPEQALRMAVTVPAEIIGADLARVIGRSAKDLLILGGDWMPIGTCADQINALAA